MSYVIIDKSEISSVDFSEVLETSSDTLRFSVDGEKTIVQFKGTTPSFLDGKTQYSHSEILEITSGEEWNKQLNNNNDI